MFTFRLIIGKGKVTLVELQHYETHQDWTRNS